MRSLVVILSPFAKAVVSMHKSMPKKSAAAVIFLTNISLELTWATTFLCGPIFQRLFQLSKTELGICLGAASVGALFMSLVVGHITDRHGSFPILVAGLTLVMAGVVLVILATGFPMLLASLAIVGISAAFIANANATLLADLFRDKLRRVMSLAAGLWFGSSALYALAMGAWLGFAGDRGWEAWSFGGPYLFDLVLLGTCLLLVCQVVRQVAQLQSTKRRENLVSHAAASPRPNPGLSRKKWFWIPGLAFCHGAMIISLLAWISPAIQAKFGVSEFMRALPYGMVVLSLAVGRLILAGIELVVDERILLAFSAIAGGAFLGLGLVAPTYGIALAALGVAGLGASATYPCILSLVGTRFSGNKAQLYGYMEASIALAGLLSPPIVGVLADQGLPLWFALGISPLAALTLGFSSLLWKLRDPRGMNS